MVKRSEERAELGHEGARNADHSLAAPDCATRQITIDRALEGESVYDGPGTGWHAQNGLRHPRVCGGCVR